MYIRIIILVAIFGYFITIAEAGSTTYLSYVDDMLGFYKVRNLDTPPRKFEYNSHTLNINQGDTLIWQNDAEKTTFTILSDQNLWDNTVGYMRIGSKVNYRFDIPGKYTFYMKEHTSIRQTIIVKSSDFPTKTPAITPTIVTPIPTPRKTVDIVITPFKSNNKSSRNISQSSMYEIPKISDKKIFDIKIPIKISPTTIAGIVVAILSIFITYKVGRNKRL